MTVGTTIASITVDGNGATTTFAYPFLMPAASDAVVTYISASGVVTVLLATQYVITGIGAPQGGTVTYPTSGPPIPAGTTLTIDRVLPLIQSTSVSSQGPIFAAIESALDYEMMCIQQIAGVQALNLTGNISDPPGLNYEAPPVAARAGQAAGWDSQGNFSAFGFASVPISTAMQPVVASATILGAQELLEASAWPAVTPGDIYPSTLYSLPQVIVANGQITRAAGSRAFPLAAATNVITAALYSEYAAGAGENIFQAAVTGLAELYNVATRDNGNVRAIYGCSVDYSGSTGQNPTGGSFIEAIRGDAVAAPGIQYSAVEGGVFYATAAAGEPYRYIIGVESSVDNQYAAAPPLQAFNTAPVNRISASFMASTGEGSGTYAPDAGFLTNPYSTESPWQTGFLAANVAENGFGCTATCDTGLSLEFGTYSAGAIRIPNNIAIDALNVAGNGYVNMIYTDLNNAVNVGMGGTSTLIGSNLAPNADNTLSNGHSGARWTAVWAVNGTIQTSDASLKTDIAPLPSALPIVLAINPVSFKWIVGGMEPAVVQEERSVQETKEVSAATERIEVKNGVATVVAVPGTRHRNVWDRLPVVDSAGKPVMVPNWHKRTGKIELTQRTHRVPRMVTKTVSVTKNVPRTGRRTHWGFLASDVKAAFDKVGMDFGGYVKAEDGTEALRPDQLIPVVWKAVQELAAEVATLKAAVAARDAALSAALNGGAH